MKVLITKSARKFGYIIWNKKTSVEINKMLGGKTEIEVIFNGFVLGTKPIDWKYHRISIGYKFTRTLPENAHFYYIELKDSILEVTTKND